MRENRGAYRGVAHDPLYGHFVATSEKGGGENRFIIQGTGSAGLQWQEGQAMII